MKGRSLDITVSATASTVLYLGPLGVLKENIYQQDDVKQPNLSVLLMFPRQQQGFSNRYWAERRYTKGIVPQEYKNNSDFIDQISEY